MFHNVNTNDTMVYNALVAGYRDSEGISRRRRLSVKQTEANGDVFQKDGRKTLFRALTGGNAAGTPLGDAAINGFSPRFTALVAGQDVSMRDALKPARLPSRLVGRFPKGQPQPQPWVLKNRAWN